MPHSTKRKQLARISMFMAAWHQKSRRPATGPSDRDTAINDEVLAGAEGARVAGLVQRHARDLARGADAAQGLAGGEGLARGLIVAGVAQALLQRRGIHR